MEVTQHLETAQNEKLRIEIKTDWCKGCKLCVFYCPKNVLIMRQGKARILDVDRCILCNRCEAYCPDFAIQVIDKSKVNGVK